MSDVDRPAAPDRRVGTLRFTLKGRPLALTAFVEVGQEDMRRLFVPFGDLTNGTETYPGRPLSGARSHRERRSTISISTAPIHPFCYYNPVYDCPYPPRENRLAAPVRAGEKIGARGTRQ